MAKKSKVLESEVVPEKIEEAVVIVDTIPTELATIKQEYGVSLPDSVINRHVETYTPYFKTLVDLESELVTLLAMEPGKEASDFAKDLRGKYRDVRTGSKDKKAEDKKDIITEGRFLDAAVNRLEEAAKIKEAKCKEVEDHLQNLENERIRVMVDSRKTELETNGYTDTDFLNLADMPDEVYDRLLKKAIDAKEGLDIKRKNDEAEAEKKRQAEENRQARVNRLAALGFIYSAEEDKYVGAKYNVPVEVITLSDADFITNINQVETLLAEDKRIADEEAAQQKEAAERVKNRINAVTKLGLIYNTSTETYEGYGQSITLADVEGLVSDDFRDTFDLLKDKVKVVKDKQSADQKVIDDKAAADKKIADANAAEVKRLKAIEDKRLADLKAADDKKAADLKAAKLAPDLDKMRALYKYIKDLQVPEMSTAEGQQALILVAAELVKLQGFIIVQANKLK